MVPGMLGKNLSHRCKLRISIRTKGDRDENGSGPNIDRNSQDIAHQGIVPHALQDSRQECTEPIKKNVLAKLYYPREEKLRIPQGNAHFFPAKFITAHILPPLLISDSHHPLLLIRQKVGLCRVVWQSKPYQNGADCTEQSLDDVNPSRVC